MRHSVPLNRIKFWVFFQVNSWHFVSQNVVLIKKNFYLDLVASKSHFYIGHALMHGLAEDNHSVTVISPFQVKDPHKNYKQILFETSYEMFQKGNFGPSRYLLK